MKNNLLSLTPNKDIIITQENITLKYLEKEIAISVRKPAGLVIKINGGEEKVITQDDCIITEGKLRFAIRIEEDKYVLVPQVDDLEITGSINQPMVLKVVQNNLRNCLHTINKISELEQTEKQIGSSKIEGDLISNSTRGYALACQLYLIFKWID